MVDQRKKIEQGILYGQKNNKVIIYNMSEMLKVAAKDRDNLLGDLSKLEKSMK